MESLSYQQLEVTLDTLEQIQGAICDLQEWNKDVSDMNELAKSPTGMQRIAGNCMLIQAICEGVKQIDKRTEGKVLATRPDMPWRQIKGMRDVIAHGYFELDIDYITNVINNDLEPLKQAINDMIIATRNCLNQKS